MASSLLLWSWDLGHRKLNMGVPHVLYGVFVLKVFGFGLLVFRSGLSVKKREEPTKCRRIYEPYSSWLSEALDQGQMQQGVRQRFLLSYSLLADPCGDPKERS
ncbi:hypothetical protein COJ90_21085 [Priestia megaterium]|nr:hypothetical protein COJ90_21085 [Priestia megaterium]